MIFRRFQIALILMALASALTDTGRFASAQIVPRSQRYTNTRLLRTDASLHSVAFASESTGIAVGDHGVVVRTEDGGETWQVAESRVDCRLDDVLWINSQFVVAVGGGYDRITGISRGAILRSNDAGRTWRQGDATNLPRLRKLSYRTEDRVIVAHGDWGPSSLSRTFISRNAGRSFQNSGDPDEAGSPARELSTESLTKWSTITQVNAPIRDVCRAGENGLRLFAVGDHGTIARSDNSGRTWRAMRQDATRAAMLMIANEPASVAWPLLGSESLEMGHRVSLLIADVESSGDPAADPAGGASLDLVRQAAMSLGAAGADRLGSPTAETVAQWIAIHRPAVLVIDDRLPKSVHAMIVSTAIAQGISRVVSYSTVGRGESMLHAAALLPKAGVLAGDLWKDALHVVAPQQAIATGLSFRRRYDVTASDRRGESVTTGLQLEPGQKLSATLPKASRRELQIVQARVAQPQLIDQAIAGSDSADAFSAALDALLKQTAGEDRFRLAWSVLQRVQSLPDRLRFESVALKAIADRFESESAGKWAQLRVLSLDNSLEWKRLRIAATTQSGDSNRAADDGPVVPEIVAVSPFQTDDSRVVQASAVAPIQVPRARTLTDASRSKKPMPIDLAWEFHPLVLIARDAAKHRGDEQELQEPNQLASGQHSANLQRLAGDKTVRSWGKLVSGTSVIAKATTTPPRLDGKVNDPCWRGALAAAGRTPIRMAYDEDYLYVAMQCETSQLRKDNFVRTASSPIRDHDLRVTDRYELSIDTDRDLLTAMQFAMTDGGRNHDAIDGRDAWNPTWYIASSRMGDTITFEIAITRRDITDLPIVPGESWYISARPVSAGADRDTAMPRSKDWTRVTFR